MQELPNRLQTIAAAHPDKQLRIDFQGESRFGQQGTTNVWARRNSRPAAVRQTEHDYLRVLGTVCPATGHAEGLLLRSARRMSQGKHRAARIRQPLHVITGSLRAQGSISPQLNAGIVNIFLRQFSAGLTHDVHAVMIWDGAGFHTSGQLQVPSNVTLIQLPQYSPKLHPIENL